MIKLDHLDHLVLTVSDIATSCAFYSQVLGMQVVTYGAGRQALLFGNQKINLHLAGHEHEPKAAKPTPGSADLCFITSTDLEEVVHHLKANGVEIIEGPVKRTGASEEIVSIYLRDPDGNLIEVANHACNILLD